jgi:hypothetical protein
VLDLARHHRCARLGGARRSSAQTGRRDRSRAGDDAPCDVGGSAGRPNWETAVCVGACFMGGAR